MSVLSVVHTGNTVLHLYVYKQKQKCTELDTRHIHMHTKKNIFHIKEEKESILAFTDNM
jgi:hypothetical protein